MTYIEHGWKMCQIPHGTKGPISPGWNTVENAITEILPNTNIGLMHAYSGTCAIDLDDVVLASMWLADRGIDVTALFSAPDSVGVKSGRPNSGKLLYALPFPLPSKKIVIEHAGEKRCILEFRCASKDGSTVQDVLPPSVHPSGSNYEWVGNGTWEHLPSLPAPIMDAWVELLKEPTYSSSECKHDVSEAVLAMNAVDPNCDRHTWIEVGMGIATLGDEFYPAWDTWSQGSPKYPGQAETAKQWRSFKPSPNGITVSTVFHHAINAGWQQPAPDITKLFAPIPSDKSPAEIIKSMAISNALPTTDMTDWPDILVRRATELATEVGCDPVVSLMAGLSVVSGAIDKRTVLAINPSWRVPPTFWAMTIGHPSDKKSPGSKPMMLPLRKIELEDRDRHATELLIWQGKEAAHASALKAYRDWAASPEAGMPNAVPPPVPTLPCQPQPLRMVITDATTQKVVQMSEARPRGFLLYMDEMNKWLSKLADTRNTDDRGCWIQGYETGPYSMDRVGAGTILVENMGMSLYGNCQPTVFRDSIRAASADGIMQRFMPVVLNPVHNTMWQEAVPEFMSSAGEYEQLIRRTYALPVTEYRMSPEANLVFRQFCQDMLDLRKAEKIIDSSMVYQTALGKVEGNCGRLILIYHIIAEPYNTIINAATVKKVTNLFKRYLIPSMRYVYIEVGQQQDDMAKGVFNILLQWSGVESTISLAQVRQGLKIPSGDYKVDTRIRVIMDDMIVNGFAAMHKDHVRSPVWAINPDMSKTFDNDRVAMIKAKQEVQKAIYASVSERVGKNVPIRNTMGWKAEYEGE